MTTTAPSSGPSTPIIFDVKVSDVDLDVDSLGRHVDAVWTPTNPTTEPQLNDLEDKCEAGADGGLAIPITDPNYTQASAMPTTMPANSGKAMRLAINAKKAGSVTFTGAGNKLAIYRQSGGQQTKLTGSFSGAGMLNETFYLHTCDGFTTVNLTVEFTPDGSTVKGKDTVRIYPATNGYQFFVNTPATTDDYAPVEACGRVPVTVTRTPSTAAVNLKISDSNATKPVKFYDAITGGTGNAEKTFTMAAGASSKTFWVSGDATGTGARTIKLHEQNGNNWDEMKSLDITVYKLSLTVDGVTEAEKKNPGAYVGLNAGNANGSAWVDGTINHIPTKYDFDASPIPTLPNNTLTRVTVSVDAGSQTLPGKIRIDRKNLAQSRIGLWTTGTKAASLLTQGGYVEYNHGAVPSEFFIEGRIPGAAERESEVSLTYWPTPDITLPGDMVKVTVTPVLLDLKVTANEKEPYRAMVIGGWALATEPNVGNKPGFSLEAKALRTNVLGELAFFQVARCVPHLNQGAAGAIRETTATGAKQTWIRDLAPPDTGKWVRDAYSADKWFYDVKFEHASKDNVQTITAEDSPVIPLNFVNDVNILPGVGQTTRVDVSRRFVTYAVWVFPAQGQGDNKGQSVFVLGKAEWSFRVDGTIKRDPDPTITIDPFSFVATQGGNNACHGSTTFIRTNVQPERVDGPIGNGNYGWR